MDDASPRYILRNRSQALKGYLLILLGVALLVVTAIDPVNGSYVPPGLAALGLAGIAASVFILPRLIVSSEGIEAQNWLFRVQIPWNHYRELDTRFGMYIVSSDHKDVVASYPASGGISKGREQLGPKHRIGSSAKNSPALPLHTSGTRKHWADMQQAAGLINIQYTTGYEDRKKSKSHQPAPGTLAARGVGTPEDGPLSHGEDPTAFPTHRTKVISLPSASCLIVGLALLIAGVATSMM